MGGFAAPATRNGPGRKLPPVPGGPVPPATPAPGPKGSGPIKPPGGPVAQSLGSASMPTPTSYMGTAGGGGATMVRPVSRIGPGVVTNPAPATTSAPALNLNAQYSPELQSLLGQANGYISDLKNGAGEIQDTTANRIRDARLGQRRGLQQGEAFRGVGSSNQLTNFDADTTRAQISGITDVADDRQRQVGSAIGLAGGLANSMNSAALAEKQLMAQMQAQQTQQDIAQRELAFQQWLATLNASRTSPAPPVAAPAAAPMAGWDIQRSNGSRR